MAGFHVNLKFSFQKYVSSRWTVTTRSAFTFRFAAFLRFPIPATPHARTLCASAGYFARRSGMESQPRGHFQPHLTFEWKCVVNQESQQSMPTHSPEIARAWDDAVLRG